jgi:hypothetical protein
MTKKIQSQGFRVIRWTIAASVAALLLVPGAWSPTLARKTQMPGRTVAHGAGGKMIKSASVAKNAPEARQFMLPHGAGEPTLGITHEGNVFITASDGCVTSCPGSEEALDTVSPGGRAVYRTKNEGKTWDEVAPKVGPAFTHVFSMDPYLYVDEHEDVDRIFDVDLTIACSILSYSDDQGDSWITNPAACGEPVNDHQTVFSGPPVSSLTVGYPYIVYYCFNHPAFTKCSKSLNGGISFMPTAQIQNPQCSGLNGHGITDDKGVVYVPLGNCNAPQVAISKDEGDTWDVVRVSMLPASGDPSIAVDSKGTLYYLFVSTQDKLPYLVTSTNGGKKWSAPIMVAPSNVKATNLATLDVGDPGNVAIAYYGTTGTKTPLGWNGYLAEGFGVLGKKPLFYTSTVNDPKHILKTGACQGRCGRVLDFIDVEIAPNGTPWGAYVDACATDCEKTREESIHDNQGLVGSLVGGKPLR